MASMSADGLSVSSECRDLRHSWERTGDVVLLKQQGLVRHFARHLTCTRCETVRTDEYLINRTSVARVRTRYSYPDGYRVPGGIKVADVRFALFNNAPMIKKDEVA